MSDKIPIEEIQNEKEKKKRRDALFVFFGFLMSLMSSLYILQRHIAVVFIHKIEGGFWIETG